MPLTAVPLSKNCVGFFQFYCGKLLPNIAFSACRLKAEAQQKMKQFKVLVWQPRLEMKDNEMTSEEDKAAL